MGEHVIVLEISNATEEQIQTGLGKAFADFCSENIGTGIKANVLTEKAAEEVTNIIHEEESYNE
ncbi:hypothetical protein [Alkalibacillus almallahensis]|uniref:hypothetical protein n=1 Tax=Alkalibacillus almallahensis TaxID=1379154 RepID=UPI001420B2E4|nr:hypothetical protein [Alkalibacillus almallahensis]NIK12842.1 hypothetical protein [Alkalibacillus almallahensis]